MTFDEDDAQAARRRVEGGARIVVVVNGGNDAVLLPVRDVTRSLWSVGTVTHTADGGRLGGRSGAVLV